jgi:hypothetical protein
MAEEPISPSVASHADIEEPAEEGHAPPTRQAAAGPSGTAEGNARNLLREAIEKVTAEIAYHDSEAQKHRRQAEELRKELRETYAFLQSGGKKEPTAAAQEARPSSGSEPGTSEAAKPALAGGKSHRPRSRKRRDRRKS